MKYCNKCNTPAFDEQNYCQKCGNNEFVKSANKVSNIAENGIKEEKAKNILANIKEFLTIRFVVFIKNYKRFKELPKQSKIKHICFPIVVLLVLSIMFNGNGGNSVSSQTVNNTNEHNNGTIATYLDDKRAYFNMNYREFADEFNTKINQKNMPYSTVGDIALSNIKEMNIGTYIGQKNTFTRLNDDISICITVDLRTTKDRSLHDSNVAGVYIISNYENCSVKDIEDLFKIVIGIVNPNYSENQIDEYAKMLFPASFSENFDNENYDENLYIYGHKVDRTDYSVFGITASENEESSKLHDQYEFVECSEAQLNKAIEILKHEENKNASGEPYSVYKMIYKVLGGNVQVTGDIDYFGDINLYFKGYYKGAVEAKVTYKVSLEYGDCKFSSSSLDWDYVTSTYNMD